MRPHLIQQARRFRPRYTRTFACVTHTPSNVPANSSSLHPHPRRRCSASTWSAAGIRRL